MKVDMSDEYTIVTVQARTNAYPEDAEREVASILRMAGYELQQIGLARVSSTWFGRDS